jgi:hypothetical protein
MKAYGIPRISDAENPDTADCQLYGRKTSLFGGKHTANRGSNKQRASRRVWKKAERQKVKKELEVKE